MTRMVTAGTLAAIGAIALAIAPLGAAAPATTSTTMTGCLQADGGKYMLTKLEGADAPKSRSWKTGFIKKTAAKDVEVVGASSSLKLKDQVGRKVTVSGTRDGDVRFKAQSIKQIAKSCS